MNFQGDTPGGKKKKAVPKRLDNYSIYTGSNKLQK